MSLDTGKQYMGMPDTRCGPCGRTHTRMTRMGADLLYYQKALKDATDGLYDCKDRIEVLSQQNAELRAALHEAEHRAGQEHTHVES